jgi:glycerate kinase
MALKVLVVPDKFKGTLSAREAAEAVAVGWRSVRPEDLVELLPMSDGGDGFGEVVGQLLGGTSQEVRTVDAAGRPCAARWWWEPGTRTAVIESARVIGLALLPPGEFHPFELDTVGLGAVLRAAAARGARRHLLGIGGSATNDGGFGVARSVGWQFLDADGRSIERWTELTRLHRVCAPAGPPLIEEMLVAVDVQNPLLGVTGATRIYGPQKGLAPGDFSRAEQNLDRLRQVVESDLKLDCAAEPGAGAAGGLGYGLRCFFGARLVPGFELFARYADLERRLHSAQLVITAEGAIDRSTLMGKGVGQVARRCRELGVPCLGLGGGVDLPPGLSDAERVFTRVHSIVPALTDLAQATAQPKHWLATLAARAAMGWQATDGSHAPRV